MKASVAQQEMKNKKLIVRGRHVLNPASNRYKMSQVEKDNVPQCTLHVDTLDVWASEEFTHEHEKKQGIFSFFFPSSSSSFFLLPSRRDKFSTCSIYCFFSP